MQEDLRLLDEIARSHERRRRAEAPFDDVSTAGNGPFDDVSVAGNLEVVPIAAPSTLRLLPETVIGESELVNGPSSCPICLEPYRVEDRRISLPCLHLFHSQCVKSWLVGGKDECPVCRCSVSSALGASASFRASPRPGLATAGPPGLEPSQEEMRRARLNLRYRAGASIESRLRIL